MKITVIDVEKLYKSDPKLKREDVKKLQQWLELQPHLPKATELQVISFLKCCYYSNESAKTALDAFFTIKTLCPDLLGNRNMNDPSLTRFAKTGLRGILPGYTPENYKVLYTRLMNTNPENFNFADIVRLIDMTNSLYFLEFGPAEGSVLIIDMEGSSFGHLTRVNLLVLKKYLYYVQEAMPVRLKGVHFIHTKPFLDKILMMVKPFVKKEIYELIHAHTESIETLYKFVPKEILPKDIGGGSSETFASLHAKNLEHLTDNTDLLMDEEKQLVDENKRPGKPKNVGELFGIEGTFKKLEVD